MPTRTNLPPEADPPRGRSAQPGDIGAQGHHLPRVLRRVRHPLRAHPLPPVRLGRSLRVSVGLVRRCLEVYEENTERNEPIPNMHKLSPVFTFWYREIKLPLVDGILGLEMGLRVQVDHVGDQLRLGRRGKLTILSLDAVEGLNGRCCTHHIDVEIFVNHHLPYLSNSSKRVKHQVSPSCRGAWT